MAYVLFVGGVLRREDTSNVYSKRFGRAEAFRRFRRTAAWVMNHDAFAFVVLCLATRNTWRLPISGATAFAIGAGLGIVGLGTKLWAARTLGSNAYYWHNFFDPDEAVGPGATRPHSFIFSPRCKGGFLPMYGFGGLLLAFSRVVFAAFV